MATWLDSIKNEFNSNTIKNPLDSLFPNARAPEKKVVVPSPIKAKAKTEATDVKTKVQNSIQETKDKIIDVKNKVTPLIFFGGIAVIFYMFSSKK